MQYSLWIDDIRNPKDFLDKALLKTLYWAKDGDHAMLCVRKYGMPYHLYIDFDLGKKTVMPFLRWLKARHSTTNTALPDYTIISSNPVGRIEIAVFMKAWTGK